MPDGVEILPDGRRLLVEVELTAKSRSRYLDGPPGQQPGSGSGSVLRGLLPEVATRARELDCAGVVYWCAPHVLTPVTAVVGEYQQWMREQRAQAARPEELPAEPGWAIRDLSEVPGWRAMPGRCEV